MARPELEFILLSAVVSHYHDLSILESPDLGLAVNKRVLKFTRDELIDTLSDLFCGGDISTWLVKGNGRSHPFVPTRDEIDAALCGALDLEYGLTSQGGARWEAMAQFDWNDHIGTWFEVEDGYEGASREMLEVYLSWSGCAVPGSEQWSVVRPWKATYWKSLPEGVRVRYRERPSSSTVEHGGFRALWIDDYCRLHDDALHTFIPMGPSRTEPTPDSRWRIRFRSVAQRSTRELLRLLDTSDCALQYVAGLKLAQTGDASFTPALLAWFLSRRCYSASRVVAQINDPRTLDAFIEVFKTEPWSDRPGRDTRFRCDLRAAIGRFRALAVAKLAPLLRSELVEMQIAVLRTLGETDCVEAGTLILEWPHTLQELCGRHPSPRATEALRALAQLKDLRALPLFAEIIRDEPGWAIQTLTLYNHVDAWKLLNDFAQSNANIHFRRMALCYLAKCDPTYQDDYRRVNSEADAECLRRETLFFLGSDSNGPIDDPIGALVDRLAEPDPKRRVTAVTLLCRHQGQFPIERIVELLDDRVPEVRANAAYALGLRGTRREASAVQRLVGDTTGLVRYCARDALKRLENRVG